MSHLFNETYGLEKPGVDPGRPGEMSGSYGDSDMFNLPQLFEMEAEAVTHQGESDADSTPGDPGARGKTQPRLTSIALSMMPLILLATLTLGIFGLVVSGIPAHQEHGVLKNTGKVNISRCSSTEFPPAWHNDIKEKDRAAASWVRQAEGKQNNSFMRQIRVLCNSANGKYPGIDTVLTTPPSTEVQGSTAPALNKLVEFLAIITLVLSGIALALTLI